MEKMKPEIQPKADTALTNPSKLQSNLQGRESPCDSQLSEDKLPKGCDSLTRTTSPSEGKLPKGVFKAYGCNTCEWRSTDECPIKSLNSQDSSKGLEFPYNPQVGEELPGICDKRKRFLIEMSRHYDTAPSFDQWQRDLTLMLQHQQYLTDVQVLTKLSQEITEAKVSGLSEKAGKLQKSYNRLREQCHINWVNVTKFNDAKVARDTPRKLEVTHDVKVRPSDIAQKIREARQTDVEVIEAEVSEEVVDSKGTHGSRKS